MQQRRLMKNSKHCNVLLIFALTALLSSTLYGADLSGRDQDKVPTVGQLIKAIQASRQKYHSWDVVYASSFYKTNQAGKRVGKPINKNLITWRKEKNRTYGKSVRTLYQGKAPDSPSTTTYMTTPKWSRQLTTQAGRRPRGIVMRKDAVAFVSGETVGEMLRAPLGGDLISILSKGSVKIRRDQTSSNLIIEETRGSGYKVIFEIDPHKGWVPIRGKLINPKGGVNVRFQMNDYREVKKGLWVPYHYSYQSGGDMMVYEVKDVKLNTDIPESQMKVTFPVGTMVDDRMHNMVYIVVQHTGSDATAKGGGGM